MDLTGFTTLHVDIRGGVAHVLLDNPPVNALGATMIRELHELLGALGDDPSVRVIVFSSANEDFFLAHVDLHIFEEMDQLRAVAASNPEVNVFQATGELLRHQPQITIVKLAGVARAAWCGIRRSGGHGLRGEGDRPDRSARIADGHPSRGRRHAVPA